MSPDTIQLSEVAVPSYVDTHNMISIAIRTRSLVLHLVYIQKCPLFMIVVFLVICLFQFSQHAERKLYGVEVIVGKENL